MQKHELEQRLARARALAERNGKSAERHGKRARRYTSRGEREKAADAHKLRTRARKLEERWNAEVRRLERSLQISKALAARAPAPRATVEERPLTPKERRKQQKRERLARADTETTRKRLAGAGIDWDPRTAQGRRQFDIASLGPSMRASLNHFNSCFKRRPERTDARILAWSYFDEHCHRVHAGEIATPRYEPGIDAPKKPAISDSRLDAQRRDVELRAWLGRDMHGLLVQVIYLQKGFRELEAEGFGDERLISLMFKRALDLAACYWRVGEDNSFGREVNRVLHQGETA